MLRFGKALGTLDRRVTEVKLVNSADPDLYISILKGDMNANALFSKKKK